MLVVEMKGKGLCWPGQILKLEFLETLLLQKAKDSLSYSVIHIWPPSMRMHTWQSFQACQRTGEWQSDEAWDMYDEMVENC